MPSLSIHRWSFGGNRLQIKSETRLLADIEAALQTLSQVGFQVEGNFQSLAAKQELLCLLLENERMRLLVWLYPLDYDKKHVFPLARSSRAPVEVCKAKDMKYRRSSNSNEQTSIIPLLSAAWNEHPGLAIQLAVRFPSSRLIKDVRSLLLGDPEGAIDEPDALQILLGPSLPLDIGSQLKVRDPLHEDTFSNLRSSSCTGRL